MNPEQSAAGHAWTIKNEPLSPVDERCQGAGMPIIADVESLHSYPPRKQPVRTFGECYGPIVVYKRLATAPTFATGRRVKIEACDDEEQAKHELRRLKNREAARRLKKERDDIEQDLATQIDELKSQERDLLTSVEILRLYKRFLEERCEQISDKYEPGSPDSDCQILDTNV